jgi:hypothetical protein
MSLRPPSRAAERKAAAFKTLDPDESRRKREDSFMHLRKETKDDTLQKKRRESSLAMSQPFSQAGGLGPPVRVRRRLHLKSVLARFSLLA